MANESSNKFPVNLKVPPLKIVLSSSDQNNSVVNIANSNQSDRATDDGIDNNSSNRRIEHKKFSQKHQTNIASQIKSNDDEGKFSIKRGNTGDSQTEDLEPPSKIRVLLSSSSSSSSSSFSSSSPSSSSESSICNASDRSNTTSPVSDSGSHASNSTIISENQTTNVQTVQATTSSVTTGAQTSGTTSNTVTTSTTKTKSNRKDAASNINISGKLERWNKGNNSGQAANHNSGTASNKKTTKQIETHVSSNNNEQQPQISNSETSLSNSKEQQILNANQRITRSSQRAAQQNKSDNNQNDANNEESNSVLEPSPDKALETAKKVKRRKADANEGDQEGAQPATEAAVVMEELCPANYQLPSQNSFQLFRDIRERPHKKLLKLNSVSAKLPMGFKDYLINSGPYLLNGNKLGVGMAGKNKEYQPESASDKGAFKMLHRVKQSYSQGRIFINYQSINPRHNSYNIPKLVEPPKILSPGSELFNLFQDQEKVRQQMRIQHLKERERFVLTAEQEVMRAYNKAVIADNKQELHLSACTYLYYQEKYHYLEDKSCREAIDNEDLNRSLSDEDFKALNKEILLDQLQEIDDKWEKIRKEILIRHKNEADSLHAVQSLEWEWKAKEIGECDVRTTPLIDSELVARVEVETLDY